MVPQKDSVDTGRKLYVHKTFRRRSGRLLNVLYTFNLRSVYTGELIMDIHLLQMISAFILELQLNFFGLPIIKNENVKYHKCIYSNIANYTFIHLNLHFGIRIRVIEFHYFFYLCWVYILLNSVFYHSIYVLFNFA